MVLIAFLRLINAQLWRIINIYDSAARPPHSAVSLRLTVAHFLHAATPPTSGRSLKIIKELARKGEAFPHCTAAQPQKMLARRLLNHH
jgi:hypothetical protein